MTTRFRFTLALLLALPVAALAQTTPGVGIGTTTPNSSAALDVSSTSQGLLPPRMTQAQRDAINPAATAAGLVVFNTSTNKLNNWNGIRWEEVVTGTEAALAGQTVTFGYTGAPQTYTVPSGVRALTVDAAGAAGQSVVDGIPGLGARVQATLTVTPGETLTLYVGGGGGTWLANGFYDNSAGGYNGGGNGASYGRNYYDSGGGGGASDVRRSATAPSTSLTERLLVAAGGGGCATFGDGGDGGAPTGADGTATRSGATAGSGATQTAGGNAGGGLGQGGAGYYSYGGGGGGGYYGGGGGGWYGGGGGGSSYAGAGTSAVTYTQGYRGGDGYVTLSFGGAPPNPPAPYLDGSNISGVIKNQTTQQTGANFNIGGNGIVGGKLGIGTSSPAAKLTVQPASEAEVGLRVTNGVADGALFSGNIVLQTLTGSNGGFSFLGFNGANNNGEVRYNTSKNRWRLGVDQRDYGLDAFFLDTYDGTTGVSVLRATTAGNVGIGTTGAPGQKLEVAGQVFSSTGGFRFPDNTVQTTAATNTPTVTASNGLTRTGTDIALGGTLTQNTTLLQSGNSLSVGTGGFSQVSQLVGNSGAGLTAAPGAGQTFTLPAGASITQVDVYEYDGRTSTGTFTLYQGAPGGTVLGSQAVTYAAYPAVTSIVLTTPVVVGAAGQYSFRVGVPGQFATSNTDTYGGGSLYAPGPQNADMKFVVYYTTASTLTLYAGSTGNVGIGTSAPAQKLDVRTTDGTARIVVGTTANTGGGIAFGNPSHGIQRGFPSLNADNNVGFYTTAGNLYLAANGPVADQFVLTTGGSVGIGTSTPSSAYKLDVNGGIRCTSFLNTSDRRFKQHIRPLTSALSSVLALRGVRYEWNALGVQHGGTAGAGQVGLIAQEVEAIYPELVGTDAQGFKSVNYAQLAPVLIEAIKELKAENDALKAQVATQAGDHADLQTLKEQLRQLQEAVAPSGQARR